jgi:hypothetical protein
MLIVGQLYVTNDEKLISTECTEGDWKHIAHVNKLIPDEVTESRSCSIQISI